MSPSRLERESSLAGTDKQPDPHDFLPESAFEPDFGLQNASSTRTEQPLVERRVSHPGPVQEEVARRPRRFLRTSAAISAGILLVAIVAAVAPLVRAAHAGGPSSVVITESTVTLTSSPDGAAVNIDDVQVGQTPLSLSLRLGTHSAELRSGTSSHEMSISVEAGKTLSHHVQFATTPSTGGLQISSDPPGAQVSIDDTDWGVTPLQLSEVVPGEHRVAISSDQNSVSRTVEVSAGATATLVVSFSAPLPGVVRTGVVAIDAPIDVDVLEGGEHLGFGRAQRFSLPGGEHTLDFVNRPRSFRSRTKVNVIGGRSVTVNVPPPASP
jgi:hypothetical protein